MRIIVGYILKTMKYTIQLDIKNIEYSLMMRIIITGVKAGLFIKT